MNRIALKVAICCVVFVRASLAFAQADDAEFFTSLYTSLCEKSVHNTEALHSKLIEKKLPEFPTSQAALFLDGFEGHAYPIPHNGQMGNFVLSLPTGKNICLVFARRLDVQTTQTLFAQMAGNPPVGTVAERQPDVDQETGPNGKTHTVSFIWTPKGGGEKILLMQTTASSPTAMLQAMTSVSVVAP
ncbi:hypothetical protein KZJ38_25075 [Paraburkholderia edwinii]|uniref:Uncharacterized protein n=1 Tax=Paraburkholderia edwinii TaxID=2861782 RepID=A0ABX8V1J4_9BURK|nr:hypothetical protein [Paraburkholderia edwinii]QYD72955.1 hypothetical protein KZJ38_25075 [Paraburkholderia edwinii]